MGGCATKPSDPNVDAVPAELPSSPEQVPKSVEGNPPVEDNNEGEKQKAENENKKEPLLVDLSDTKPEENNPAGDSTANDNSAVVTDLVSEIGGLAPLASQDLPKEDSDDSKKIAELNHVEKPDNEKETTHQGKEVTDKAKDSQTASTAINGTEKDLEARKSEGNGEGLSTNSKVSERNDNENSLKSA